MATQLKMEWGAAALHFPKPARCERPPFVPGDRFTVRGFTYIVRESCMDLTTLDLNGERDNRTCLEWVTPRLWEAIWGRTVMFSPVGRVLS